MKRSLFIPMIITVSFLSACGAQVPTCPTAVGTRLYLTVPPEALPTPIPETNSSPIPIDIGGKTIQVDKVIEGPLCNDTWSGTVYVTCNIQVYQWEDQPTFLKNCNLTIEPGTVVYVAYHNNSTYYNGCSCHTGETTGPYP
ncbi:MAG: hypothetical protein WAV05_02605 [Anaerolineales bacterium]